MPWRGGPKKASLGAKHLATGLAVDAINRAVAAAGLVAETVGAASGEHGLKQQS